MKLTRGAADGIITGDVAVTPHAEFMTRALLHVGLAVALVLTPTLCCCKARWFGASAHAAPRPAHAACPIPAPVPAPQPVESCCMKAKTSCCHESTQPA